MRDPRLYLRDILNAMQAIESFVGDMDFEEFKDNDLVSSAVIRKFEIIDDIPKLKPLIRKILEDLKAKEYA